MNDHGSSSALRLLWSAYILAICCGLVAIMLSGVTQSPRGFVAFVPGGCALIVVAAMMLADYGDVLNALRERARHRRVVASAIPLPTRLGGGMFLMIGIGWIVLGLAAA